MFCRYCGEKLYEDAFFCTNCGTPVNQMDLPVRKTVSAPGERADMQEASEITEPVCKATADTSAESKTETQERVDISAEPEVSTQLSTQLRETVTEAEELQVTPEQPESPEASASAAGTAARQQDAVPFQAISAGVPEFSQPQKPRERSNVALIIVTIVAAVLFLVGVWGAIYFSDGEDEMLYSRGELLTETGVGGLFPL